MENNLYIQNWVNLRKGALKINGQDIAQYESVDFDSFNKDLYKSFNISYPKYYKMDSLCKLAFLSAEALLSKMDSDKIQPEKTALVISNSSSTIETDTKFQNSLNEIASPAVFVYTLPNILIGELCIRFGFKGENLFFVQSNFEAKLLVEQTKMLFHNSDTENCIAGWVDYYNSKDYESFLMFLSKEQTKNTFTENEVLKKYNI